MGTNTPLHLHAREIQFFGANKKLISITAPLPPHMTHTFRTMGWEISSLQKAMDDSRSDIFRANK